jgi:D-serine deaminase-like pyridoxal phosphate-dependent protein
VSDRYAELRSAIAGRPLPLALLDLDALEFNAQAMLRRARTLPIRLCSKSLRSVGVLRLLQALSPHFRGVLCYSPREAAFLARQGQRDLLVAYPCVDATDLNAAAEACAAGAQITLMVDDAEQLPMLVAAARAHSVRLRVCIDLDLSTDFGVLYFGVRRSPLRSPEAVLALADCIARESTTLQLVGLMGYEAQLAGPQDDLPGAKLKSQLVRLLKRRSTPEVHARRAAAVAALRARDFALQFVNGGGTGSLHSSAEDPSVTELAAGSGLYAPALFDHFHAMQHRPALFFALSVVRRPAPDLVTCGFGGYVASGPAGLDRLPQPTFPVGMELLLHEGAGEVQTPVRLPHGTRVALGDPLFFRHAKAGELAERFERFLLLRNGQIVDEITTYRGDGQCFF